MAITITEALAEIKTIAKRIEKKREFIGGILWRPDHIKDPHEKDGGSAEIIKRERQAISDLETRVVTLRRAIQGANDETSVTINSTTRSIAEWLVWRRDVAPGTKSYLAQLRGGVAAMREQARKNGLNVAATAEVAQPRDIIVNLSEADLAKDIETLEDTLGQLDGQLSLKNATIAIKEAA